VNRQPRTLLTLLVVAAIGGTGYFIWQDLKVGDPNNTVSPHHEARPARGGRLTATLRSEPRSFNRLVSSSAVTEVFSHLTQAKLVRVNRATRTLEPWLAEKWDASPDGRTFTLTLRKGLQWSDGVPFTADDVLFTVKAVFDPRVHSSLASSLQINGAPIGITAVDASTVRLTYPAVFGPGLRLLDNLPILPRHKLETALDDGAMAQAWSAATPTVDLVGLGPFTLARYEPGQRLVFRRNPNYWRKAADGAPLPYLDEIVLDIVPDQSAELVRLQAGQSDMMQQPLRSEDLAALRPQIDAGAVSLIELGVSTDPDVFFLNLREKFWASDPRQAWITKRELRQAISHAVDREAFSESVFLGAAVPIWGPVTPGNAEWFSPNVPRYPFSVDQARSLLAAIGLSNRDGDEWLEDPHGNEARFAVLTFRGNQVMEREAAFVRDALQKVGIALEVVALEQNALVDRMLKGTFEAIYFGYNASDPDPALNLDYWLSSGGAHIWNMAQATAATPWEAEIDELMARQSGTNDQAERKRLFAEVQRIFGEQVPALYFAAPRLYMGVSGRTINLAPSVLRPQLLWSADTIAVGAPR
jgi:peptide/nickel transport system substrate-binding protein